MHVRIAFRMLPYIRFYVWYLTQVGVYAAMWVTFPLVATIGFALLTALHFGETDLEALSITLHRIEPGALSCKRSSRIYSTAHTATYGCAVLLSLMLADPLSALDIGASLIGWPADPYLISVAANVSGLARLSAAVVFAAIASALCHPYVIAFAQPQLLVLPVHPGVHQRWIGFATLLVSLSAVGAACGAALPFALYFGAWHSVQAFSHIATAVPTTELEALEANLLARSLACCGKCNKRWSSHLSVVDKEPNADPVKRAASGDDVCGVAVGEARAASPAPALRLWCHAVPLTIVALCMLPALAVLLPNVALVDGRDSRDAGKPSHPPVPPLLLVLLAVLTLPHAQVMHDSYRSTRCDIAP